MPRASIGETAMTGAKRQARYRAAQVNGVPVIRIRRPVDRRSRIQRWNDTIAAEWNCRPSMPHGWTRCRTTNRTVCSPRRCARLSNSISPSFRRLSRQEASAVIEKRDGPCGMGRDDARGGVPAPSRRRSSRGVIAVIRAAVQTLRNDWEWKNASSIDW